jgi:hypothetical protein
MADFPCVESGRWLISSVVEEQAKLNAHKARNANTHDMFRQRFGVYTSSIRLALVKSVTANYENNNYLRMRKNWENSLEIYKVSCQRITLEENK